MHAQVEADRALVENDGARDAVAECGLVRGVRELAGQRVPRVLDVGRRHRIAVRELRLRVEAKCHRALVGCDLELLGEQAVHRHRLVGAVDHQRLEHEQLEPGRRSAAHRERVVLVEWKFSISLLQ